MFAIIMNYFIQMGRSHPSVPFQAPLHGINGDPLSYKGNNIHIQNIGGIQKVWGHMY